MLITENVCFSAHAYQNPEVTVWSRTSSESRRTVLISMLGASFYLFTVYLLGALKYAQSNPVLIRVLGASKYAQSNPVLIRMLGASMYAQSNPVLIRMLGASKYVHSNHFWTSNIISNCRCEHAHKSQCMLFRACSSHPLLVY